MTENSHLENSTRNKQAQCTQMFAPNWKNYTTTTTTTTTVLRHYTRQPALAGTSLRTGGFCWHKVLQHRPHNLANGNQYT